MADVRFESVLEYKRWRFRTIEKACLGFGIVGCRFGVKAARAPTPFASESDLTSTGWLYLCLINHHIVVWPSTPHVAPCS